MAENHELKEQVFPRAGVRARRWQRFERAFSAWLSSPEGCFAVWQAQREREAFDVTPRLVNFDR